MKKVVKKPWGNEEEFALNSKCTVKILTVKPLSKTSLQYHYHRDEFWKVIDGKVRIWIGNRKILAKVGDEFFIKRKVKHRLEGLSVEGKVLEISFGKFDEKDIVRVEDDYGRTES